MKPVYLVFKITMIINKIIICNSLGLNNIIKVIYFIFYFLLFLIVYLFCLFVQILDTCSKWERNSSKIIERIKNNLNVTNNIDYTFFLW